MRNLNEWLKSLRLHKYRSATFTEMSYDISVPEPESHHFEGAGDVAPAVTLVLNAVKVKNYFN
jgi:hypothetical protein